MESRTTTENETMTANETATANETSAGRTHRVGTITAGLCMVVFGVMFLLHTVFDMMNYSFILSLWPIIIIGMGVELLLFGCTKAKLIYDKAAIFLLIVMTFFAIGMACVDIVLRMPGILHDVVNAI